MAEQHRPSAMAGFKGCDIMGTFWPNPTGQGGGPGAIGGGAGGGDFDPMLQVGSNDPHEWDLSVVGKFNDTVRGFATSSATTSLQNNVAGLISGRVALVPFVVDVETSYDMIFQFWQWINSTTVEGAFGFYDSNEYGHPVNLIWNQTYTVTSQSAPQQDNISPTLTLQPGLYWLASTMISGDFTNSRPSRWLPAFFGLSCDPTVGGSTTANQTSHLEVAYASTIADPFPATIETSDLSVASWLDRQTLNSSPISCYFRTVD